MKKFYLILTFVLCSILGIQAQGITLPYYQDFAALTSGGTANSGNSQSQASASDVAGFAALVKGYKAGGVLRLGTSSAVGSLTTETFATSGTIPLRVTFKAMPWTSATPQAAKVCVQYGSQSDTTSLRSFQ